jgi:hypothetical protein
VAVILNLLLDRFGALAEASDSGGLAATVARTSASPAAIGTSPAATAAHEPPEEPLVDRSNAHGLCVGTEGERLCGALHPKFRKVGLPERDEPCRAKPRS